MQTIRTSPTPAGEQRIPPVSDLKDLNGVVIGLDVEVIVNRNRDWKEGSDYREGSYYRAKVVGIGDEGLPGRQLVIVRPHGSTYVEKVSPKALEVHVFDQYEWVASATDAAHSMASRGVALEQCLFGGFHFDVFQKLVCSAYVKRIG